MTYNSLMGGPYVPYIIVGIAILAAMIAYLFRDISMVFRKLAIVDTQHKSDRRF